MPSSSRGWIGSWSGVWTGPPLGASTPGGTGPVVGSIITEGYGSSRIVVQGYGLPSGGTSSGTGSIISDGYGSSQLVVQGYGLSLGVTTAILGVGGVSWGGTTIQAESTFLSALVSMLKSSSPLTGAIGGARVFSTWPGSKVALPFVLIEDYIESQPGETIEHNVNTVVFAAYGPDKTSVKTVLTALMNSVDSPAQNKNSTRVPMRWSTGTEESSWRQPTLPPMRTKIRMRGTDLWCWKIQYEFNILPNFQY